MRTPLKHRKDLNASIGIEFMMMVLSSSAGSSTEMDGRVRKPSVMASSLRPTTKVFASDSTLKMALGPEEEYIDCSREMDDDDMMDEKLWSSLPQALVEEVLARLPFKLLFQCRVLSRAWRWSGGGGRSTNRKQQQVQQESSHFFEKSITSVSSKWPTYCPVYLFQDGLVGYNSESKAWDKIFDLNMFPSGLLEGVDTTTVTSCAGALVCFASVNFLSSVDVKPDSLAGEPQPESWSYKPLDNEIYVVNVVTRKWKRLPPRPTMQRPNIMHLIPVGSTEYKIILLTQLESTEGSCMTSMTSTIVTQIYSSSSNSWIEKTSKSRPLKWRTSLSNFVYLDRVFYIATGGSSPIDPPLLHVHNVEKGTWNTIVPPLPVERRQLVKYHVLLCGSEVILVARVLDQGSTTSEEAMGDVPMYRDLFFRPHNFIICKLDLATGGIKEVSRCPREKLAGVGIDQVLAHGDTIYFGGKHIRKTPMMMYNVRKHEWAYHISAWEMPKPNVPLRNGFFYVQTEPDHYYWTHSALQPGLNPLSEV